VIFSSQSERPGMGVVCQHGLSAEDSEERHWQTSKSMTASGPDPSQKSESKNQPESESKNLRIIS
jgi:hypothetical protein